VKLSDFKPMPDPSPSTLTV